MAKSALAQWQFIAYQIGIALLLVGKILVDLDGSETLFLQIGATITILATALMLYLFATKSIAP